MGKINIGPCPPKGYINIILKSMPWTLNEYVAPSTNEKS
jgi:hypothetical protein